MEYNAEEYTEEYDAYGYPVAVSHDDYHSGDPRLNMEYESYKIPEGVRNFLISLSKAVDEGNVYELQNLYEISYVKLTDRFFKTTPWPLSQDVEMAITNDQKFIILYKELYYRHLYARVNGGPNIQERFDSYFNYCNLFNLILSSEQPVHLELPNQWLWEIIDEFIYQFQNYSHYQSMLLKRTPDEIKQLKANLKVWNVHSILNVLHSLVDKSNINRQLEVYTNGGDPDSVAGEFGRHPLYKMLGYFSLVGLLRLHSLVGDYYQAIKVLENIELNKKSLYSRVPACQITTYYYVGFSYMMMRRYSDAIRTFSNILLYIQRIHRSLLTQRTYQIDQINKQTERMYALLAICLVLHPQRIDESVLSQLKEKHGDKLLRMQRCDLSEFESSFSFACPKFLSPVPPSFKPKVVTPPKVEENLPNSQKLEANLPNSQNVDANLPNSQKLEANLPNSQKVEANLPTSQKVEVNLPTSQKVEADLPTSQKVEADSSNPQKVEADSSNPQKVEANSQKPQVPTLTNSHKEPFLAQLKVFMDEIQQQLQLPIIRSYLKLYTTMPIAKLATFLDVKEADFVSSLLCFKHKMKNLVWTKGTSGLEGEFQSGSEVDFFIDKDMIHIADTKVARRYGDFFIRQIHKFDELHRMITSLQM